MANRLLTSRTLFAAALLIFASVLAIMLGLKLAGTAAAIAFGAAIGVLIGVPVGVITSFVLVRRGFVPHESSTSHLQADSGAMMLTSEQAEALLNLLSQRSLIQPAPGQFARPIPRDREFTVVGGADLDDPSSE